MHNDKRANVYKDKDAQSKKDKQRRVIDKQRVDKQRVDKHRVKLKSVHFTTST